MWGLGKIMAGPNRFFDASSAGNAATGSLLHYLRVSIEKGTEVDLEYVKEEIDGNSISPEDLEEIRAKALEGARKFGEQAYKNPKDKSKIVLSGIYTAIASHTARSSGYRHTTRPKSLELGD
jgi:hypothetical protein